MTTKQRNRLTLAIWTLMLGVMIGLRQSGPSYSVRTFASPAGWGYDILRSNAPLIHQPTRPGAAGQRGFANEAQARRVGERVLTKIRQGQFPPTLRPNEIE
jgi:hypothetical protein